jgi:hypothetical protein
VEEVPGGSGQLYPTIFIDGKNIETLHDQLTMLVPAMNEYIFPAEDRELVWRLLEPRMDGQVIAPILVCGDDCDLYCTVVVAEITYKKDTICWERLGFDVSENENVEKVQQRIGLNVDWIVDIPPMTFDREEYTHSIMKLKKVMDTASLLHGFK